MEHLAQNPAVFITIFTIVALVMFLLGWTSHRWFHTPITTQDINAYIQQHLPNEWAAYKRGVSEGYAQGLRDCQEDPDEPA